MSMASEFKEFAVKGNVVDLAVGIIIGGAFGKIVSSLVNDVIMPPIGLLLGKVDFSNLFINLSGQGRRVARRREEGGPRDAELRAFPEHLHRVPHRRLRRLSSRQADQPAQEGGARRSRRRAGAVRRREAPRRDP